MRDERLKTETTGVTRATTPVTGARKIYYQLRREGLPVAHHPAADGRAGHRRSGPVAAVTRAAGHVARLRAPSPNAARPPPRVPATAPPPPAPRPVRPAHPPAVPAPTAALPAAGRAP
ncbi:hypothetical protein E1292_22170 [Nonomuraea deserti]|uniref:Uncharacterized protein n=1 Tax=Nonomuraea deserti TaxID=1848322 RepID=A0A4R4VJD9_9ACTN|nr:hypothetical protein E1292_22170 [Nonomuraea deserti]